MNRESRLIWFKRCALMGAGLAAIVVVLGAWVRLTNAGLGCPDWPGCYGHIVPQPLGDMDKAWHEMIHRYAATTLGVVISGLFGWALVNRKDRAQPLIPVGLLFVVVCLQGTLGALTVTLLLKPLIVTGHLFGGLTTLALLWWLAITPLERMPTFAEVGLRKFAVIGCIVLCMQIFLGGWTSTNYAAVACPDFPTCQRSWWPGMDFRDAFALQHGLGVDYEGGVLANPARIAIHFMHRVGAVMAGSVLIALGLLTMRRAEHPRLAGAGLWVVLAVTFQIAVGIATVHFGIPLPLATLHNAGAALLVASMVWLLRALWPAAPATVVARAGAPQPASGAGMVPLSSGHHSR